MQNQFSDTLSSILSCYTPTSGTVAVLMKGDGDSNVDAWDAAASQGPSTFRKNTLCRLSGFSVKGQIETILRGNQTSNNDSVTPGWNGLNQVALKESTSLTLAQSQMLSLASQLAAAEEVFLIPDLQGYGTEDEIIEMYENVIERSLCRSTPTICLLNDAALVSRVAFPHVILWSEEGIVFDGNANFARLFFSLH